MRPNKPLHAESRAARFGEINVVRRGPVNGDIRRSSLGVMIMSAQEEKVLLWFAGWLIPAIVAYFAIASDTKETRSITNYDKDGNRTGRTDIETGNTKPGNPDAGLVVAILWIVGYFGYWLFYGWWH